MSRQPGQPGGVGGDRDAPPVGRVGRPGDIPGLLETVKHLGHRAAGQAQPGGQVTGGGWAVGQQAHAPEVGQRHAELVGDGDIEPAAAGPGYAGELPPRGTCSPFTIIDSSVIAPPDSAAFLPPGGGGTLGT